MIKEYYRLIKPGIVYGNGVATVAGFLLASSGKPLQWSLFFATLIGISCVIASGCVLNNYIDRDIDALMERTRNRPLVIHSISTRHAVVFGTLLGLVGFIILLLHTNLLVVYTAGIGFFVYVILYSLWLKRPSTHGALIGSISGAVPLVAGYLAVRGNIDAGAIILFFILSLWQMPHALAIAIFRLRDYQKAGISVIPVIKGIHAAKVQMLNYAILFMFASLLLAIFGYVGQYYYFVMFMLSGFWLLLCAWGFFVPQAEDRLWARKVFFFSILILVAFCVVISIDGTGSGFPP